MEAVAAHGHAALLGRDGQPARGARVLGPGAARAGGLAAAQHHVPAAQGSGTSILQGVTRAVVSTGALRLVSMKTL